MAKTGGNFPPASSVQTGGSSDAAVQKLKNTNEYKIVKLQLLKQLGGKTLDVVNAEISKDSIRQELYGRAIDAADAMDKRIKKEREEKFAKEALKEYDKRTLSEMSQYEIDSAIARYKEKNNTLLKKMGGLLKNIPVAMFDNVRRNINIRTYKSIGKKAIQDTGKLEAAGLALSAYMQKDELPKINKTTAVAYAKRVLKDKEAAGESDESHFAKRVEMKAKGIDEFANDDKVTLENKDSKEYKEEKNTVKSLYADYLYAISKAAEGRKGNKAVKNARENFLKQMKDIKRDEGKTSYNNNEKILKQLDDAYRGKFKDILKKKETPEKHRAALDAIDGYLEKNLNYMSGKVQTGLDMKNAAYKKTDAAVFKYGVLIGSAFSVAGMIVKSIGRSKAIKALEVAGSLGSRIVVAGAFGGIAGALSKTYKQRYNEMREAIGEKVEGEDKKSLYQKISVSETVERLKAAQQKLLDGDDKERNQALIAKIIGDVRARTSIQKDKKIALMSYDSRESIEKQKFELMEAMSEAKKTLVKSMVNRTGESVSNNDRNVALVKAEKKIGRATELAREYVEQDVAETKKAKRGERVKAALKGAAIAGASAAIVSVAKDFLFSSVSASTAELPNEAGGNSDIASNINSGNAVSGADIVEDSAAATNADAYARASKNVFQILDDETGGKSPEKLVEYSKGAAVLIEDDPQGGIAIGFDNNNNGVIDLDEYYVGGGENPGVNLVNRENFEAVQGDLAEKYDLHIEREAIDATKYNQVMVNDYLEKANNVVDVKSSVVDVDSYSVKLGTPIADKDIDGMTQYVVNVDGNYPDGTKLFIDLDGNGSGKVLEFSIEDGKAVIPADVVDATVTGEGGAGDFLGHASVGRLDGDRIVAYAEADGGISLSATDSFNASVTEPGYAFVITDEQNETVSTFAINTQGNTISNTSEIFNGITVGGHERLPAGFSTVEGIEDHGTFANGEKIPDVGEYHGGYNAQYDSSINYPFKGSPSFVGSAYTWDVNGDGIMGAAEQTSFFKQQLVRIATNPYVLGQNASNYGLLEPEVLAKNLFNGDMNAMTETLKSWGVSDGIINSEKDLQGFLDHLKMAENADYYDKLVNSTITEVQDSFVGGGFEQGTVTERMSTYINKDGSIDTKINTSVRTVFYPYKTGPNGEKIYVGNKGWWVRKYYGEEGGKVGDLPLCEQKSIVVGKDDSLGDENQEKIPPLGEENQDKVPPLGEENQDKVPPLGEENQDKVPPLGEENQDKVPPLGEENQDKVPPLGEENQDKVPPLGEENQDKAIPLGEENQDKGIPIGEENQDKGIPIGEENQDKGIPLGEENQDKGIPLGEENQDKGIPIGEENQDKGIPLGEENTGKTGNMNSGDKTRPMDTSRTDLDAKFATEDNKITADVHPGDQINEASEEVYMEDAVLDEEGQPMRDSNGNMYIQDPDRTETPEEIRQNIEDNTQTTYTEDTTNYNPDANTSVASEYWAEEGEPASDLRATGLGRREEIPDLSDERLAGPDETYTEAEQDRLRNVFGIGTDNTAPAEAPAAATEAVDLNTETPVATNAVTDTTAAATDVAADVADTTAAATDVAADVADTTTAATDAAAEVADTTAAAADATTEVADTAASATDATAGVNSSLVDAPVDVDATSTYESAASAQPAAMTSGTSFEPTATSAYTNPNAVNVDQTISDEEEERLFNAFGF